METIKFKTSKGIVTGYLDPEKNDRIFQWLNNGIYLQRAKMGRGER